MHRGGPHPADDTRSARARLETAKFHCRPMCVTDRLSEGTHERKGVGCGRQGEAMAEELPYGTYWTHGEEARRLHDILEVTGPENVRALVANKPQGDWAIDQGRKNYGWLRPRMVSAAR